MGHHFCQTCSLLLILLFTDCVMDEWDITLHRAHVYILLSLLSTLEKLVCCGEYAESFLFFVSSLLSLFSALLKNVVSLVGDGRFGYEGEGQCSLLSVMLFLRWLSGPGLVVCMANTPALRPLTRTSQ